MPHIVVRRSVRPAQVVRVLRICCEGRPEPVRERSQSAIRYFIECMAVSVISLKHPLTPATKPVLKRNHHAVVIGDCPCLKPKHLAESRVWRTVSNGIGTTPCRKRSKSPRVRAGVRNHLVDSVVTKVADAKRSMRVKSLLQLHAPSLVLWLVRALFSDQQGGRNEIRN